MHPDPSSCARECGNQRSYDRFERSGVWDCSLLSHLKINRASPMFAYTWQLSVI